MNVNSIKVKNLKPLRDSVLVTEMNFDERKTTTGIVIAGDDGMNRGIRPRWAKVYSIGPNQTEIEIGQWVCVKHGRWTRGVKIDDGFGEKVIRKIDNDDILLVSDEPILDDTIGLD